MFCNSFNINKYSYFKNSNKSLSLTPRIKRFEIGPPRVARPPVGEIGVAVSNATGFKFPKPTVFDMHFLNLMDKNKVCKNNYKFFRNDST